MKTAKALPQVFYVWNYVAWGGAQIHLISIMRHALADRKVTVLMPKDSSKDLVEIVRSAGAEIIFLKHSIDLAGAVSIGDKLRRQFRRIRSEAELLSFFRKVRPRPFIVHIETAPWQSWQLLTLLWLFGAKVFVTCHNMLEDGPLWRRIVWKTRLRSLLAIRAVDLFAANLDTKKKMQKWLPRSYFDRVPITYTAVDPIEIEAARMNAAERSSLRRRHGINDGEIVVLCVGQFIDRKGRWIFLEAAKRSLEDRRRSRFIWLTPNLPVEADIKKIDSYELGSTFRMFTPSDVGNSRLQILKFFNIADIFVLPSFVEGLPISLLEAMALGIPCVSTNINSIPEAVINNVTGLLIEPGDADALLNVIGILADDPQLRDELAENARSHVLEKFDERRVAETVLSAYAAAIKAHA